MEKFPHLVQMHQKYAAKGLAVVAVSLDPAGDHAKVGKFLTKHRATFTNLLLDEEAPFWSEKLKFAAAPALYVFDRRGKWVQFTSDETPIDHAHVEKTIVQMLAEKEQGAR